jgi:hypothetical protein
MTSQSMIQNFSESLVSQRVSLQCIGQTMVTLDLSGVEGARGVGFGSLEGVVECVGSWVSYGLSA